MADFQIVPNATVFQEEGTARRIQNPLNNLKSSSGIERIPFNGIDELDTEKGPNGETVHALNTGDSRIRFVGSGWIIDTGGVAGGLEGTIARGSIIEDYVEITFFGTHLNLLTFMNAPGGTAPDWRVSSDGGTTEGSNIFVMTSDVLNGKRIKTNVILPVFSSTSAGVHTIRIRNASASNSGLTLFGCEIINENAAITQQPGADFDGRVEALSGTSFPIEPNNTTVPSVNGRNTTGTAASYGTHSTGARVLNYLTSGGQYKQSFNLADEAISAGSMVPANVAASIYTLIINGPGSGTGTITDTVTVPDETTAVSIETFGAGGDGGAGVRSGGLATASGGGGGGGAYANASYTKTARANDTLAIVAGAGSETGNINNTTVTGGGMLSGSFTVNSGIMGGNADAGNSDPAMRAGVGMPGGTAPANANITGLTLVGTATLGAGNAGTNGETKLEGTGGDGNVEGGMGGLPGNQSGNTDNGGVGRSGTGGTGVPMGGPGEIPGGGGGGGGSATPPFGSDGAGGQGGLGRVTITVRARSGLTASSFGTNNATISSVSDGTIDVISTVAAGTPINVFASASHGNQEVIRRINVREFGANNQFATASNAISAFFTLDDGTTTLTAERSGTTNAGDLPFATAFGKSYISFNRTGGTDGRKSLVITFVGTGLDTEWIYSGGTSAVYGNIDVTIDGLSIGNLTPIAANAATNTAVVRPIVSGLSYGTHTVSFTSPNNSSGFDNSFGIADFILYGPKKPEIPTLDAGSLELSDYNIMADYVARTATGTLFLSKGTIAKTPDREITYTGSGSRTPSDGFSDDPFGVVVGVTGANDTVSYTFYGTGINVQARTNNVTFANTVQVDGVALGSRFSTTTLTEGGGNYVTGTSTWTGGAGAHNDVILITGMPLGVHTIEFTRTAGQFLIEGMWIETPIHINEPSLKVGSEGLNNLTIDPVVEEDEAVVLANLGEAKAWIKYDPLNNVVSASYNIAAAIETLTNNSQLQVFFDKPFKSADYAVTTAITATSPGGNNEIIANTFQQANFCRIQTENGSDTFGLFMVFYGELIDE